MGAAIMIRGDNLEVEALLIRRFERVAFSEDGQANIKYTAVDPASRYVFCKCKRPDCWTRQLRPIRDHIIALQQVIVSCGRMGLLEGGVVDDTWPGTTYALQMAASIEDVFADPSVTDDSESSMWCRPAYEHDEEQREFASKYVAALIIFNFVWNAYEAAVEEAAGDAFSREKTPVRGRKTFSLYPAIGSSMPGFENSFRFARKLCSEVTELQSAIDEIRSKYLLEGAAAAAELGRLFRNYIAHGGERMPTFAGPMAVARFYAVSRLLLMLIQMLIVIRLENGSAAVPLSVNREGEEALPAEEVLRSLQLLEALWVPQASTDNL